MTHDPSARVIRDASSTVDNMDPMLELAWGAAARQLMLDPRPLPQQPSAEDFNREFHVGRLALVLLGLAGLTSSEATEPIWAWIGASGDSGSPGMRPVTP